QDVNWLLAAGHGKYRCRFRVHTIQHVQVSDLNIFYQTRQNILDRKGDRQLLVPVHL
ncbi:hypothetical protein SK128_018352, partial [Halocaridina rubra]